MIDLDALHAHAERFCNSGNDRQCCITAREGVELIERLRQAEKDAARYRLLMDEKVKCPYCESEFDDFTAEADFIGWHGMCVKCFLSEDNHD